MSLIRKSKSDYPSNSMDCGAGVSPSGRDIAMTYRELLATRVLSVDAYWKELQKPRGRPPREIPVPLWPGESLQQYEREFLRWLAAGRLSLTVVRDDPVIERKYRLQFAETRVGRPSSNSQRATFRSRSRSRSPPPSHKRFGSAQQRPYVSNREDIIQSAGRRSSADSGRMSFARQSADRPRHDRSYAPWHSQTDRYTDAHEAPRPNGNWQKPHGADIRHRQDSRALPSRDVYRQHASDTQRWNHSRSRSPQYHVRAASPLRSDNPFPHVPRSTSPHDQVRSDVDNLRRQLLARRVVSVDVFRDEMNKLKNGLIRENDLKQPHETMVRIPVILWPGETMAQYTQKFEWWLDLRNISLALLRDNPAKERSLWHSFADTRAGTSELGELGARSRSRSRSSLRSIQRSSEKGRSPVLAAFAENNLLKSSNSESREHLSRREHVYPFDHQREARSTGIQHQLSMASSSENSRLCNNKTRQQLLERRILSLEAFRKEVDQSLGAKAAKVNKGSKRSSIPVPLYPKESMGLYDHRFWTWLKDYGETKESLRSNPARERIFRMAFAYFRINRPQDLTTTEDLSIETQTTLAPRPNAETHSKISVGVLKSARACSAMNRKRPVEDIEGQAQAAPDEPSSKHSQIDAEGVTQVRMTPDISSSCSTVYPEPKRKAAHSLASSTQALPRSSSVPTIAPSAGASSTATTASIVSFAEPVRLSILPQTAPEKRATLAETQTARSASIPIQRKQIKLLSNDVIARAQETKTDPATSLGSVATLTKTAAFRQTPEPPTPKPDPAATRSSPCLSAPSVAPKSPAAERTLTTAVALIRAPPNTDVSPATTTTTKANPRVNAVGNDCADTDAAESGSDIAPTDSVAHEVSDAESDPADESEQHDGDVMNPDGCCCTKCLRSWAKTLTDRMDQLEQNVVDLKRQVIGQVDAQE